MNSINKPKLLLLGRQGQVGWELRRTLAPLGYVAALDQEDLDLARPADIRRVIQDLNPRIIVNAAAYTAVDRAESEPEMAMAINGQAPGVLAEEAARTGALLVHYSTDYVFNGEQSRPYTEEDRPDPATEYGRSKLAGEQAVQDAGGSFFILRTSWVYGLRGQNFLLTMLRLAREREEIRVVNDQIGAPTWSRMIAEATGHILSRLLRTEANVASWDDIREYARQYSGIYNLTAGGRCSWYDFAAAIFAGLPDEQRQLKRLLPISSGEYPVPARRPAYSSLDNGKVAGIFGVNMPDWEDMLKLVSQDYGL